MTRVERYERRSEIPLLLLADRDRLQYALRHWYDVALIVLPFLRPLRLLRLLALARILNRSAAGSLVGRVSTYVVGVAIMAIGCGGPPRPSPPWATATASPSPRRDDSSP
jgi:hypothetical protein